MGLRLCEIAARNRREIVRAKPSRREMMALGLLTAAGTLVPKRGLRADVSGGQLVSPPTTPFVTPLTITPVAKSVAPFTPDADALVNLESQRVPYQDQARFPAKFPISEFTFYTLHERQFVGSFDPALSQNDFIWGFDDGFSGAISPGPVFHATYGKPIVTRIFNDLISVDDSFGIDQTSTHLHNLHSPSESDGNPIDFYDADLHRDFHWVNSLPGFSSSFSPTGDRKEALGFLWYHDHRFDFTAQNVYRGLIGTYLLFDDLDTGDESTGLRLPSGAFDVPLVFNDKVFDSEGKQFFDLFNTDGILGDKFLVNGKVQPFFRVARRRYRLRILNTGPSRWYKFWLTDNAGATHPFLQISSDGNLQPFAIQPDGVKLAVAERADLIIDFSKFPLGTKLFLENRLEQKDGRGPTGKILAQGTKILQFRVDLQSPGDNSQVLVPFIKGSGLTPTPLRPLPDIRNIPIAATRRFEFNRSQGAWQVNGQFFNPSVGAITVRPKANTAEIWTLKNGGGGWSHPIHIHLEEFRVLRRNGAPPAADSPEFGRKDVLELGPNDEVDVLFQFRDWLNYYPMHCHNVVHEDHAMMTQFQVTEVAA
jgi:FtsP/CotA-like multicopper oxidase with cupredoxin domain